MDIPRRDVELDLDPAVVPRDWVNGDAFQTTFLGALSLLFPEGERFFVESVKAFKDQLVDPELRRQVTGFIGQEAMHGREHRAFNDLLVAHGHPSAPQVDRWLKRFLAGVRRRALSPMSQLAVTTGLEHFTAMLAESLMQDPRMRDFDPSIATLWMWHALEESEHKTVAFDVYRAVGGGYVRRALIMLLTTAVFFAVQSTVHLRMLAERRVPPWRWLRGAARLWIYPGFLTRLVPDYLAYFRPGFHPDDRDTRALLATWRATLFDERGELRAA